MSNKDVFGNIVNVTPFMDNDSLIRNDTSDMFYSYFFNGMRLYDFNVLMKYGTIYATAEQMSTFDNKISEGKNGRAF